MIRIKIEGKNIADLWNLACVTAITKALEGNFEVEVSHRDNVGIIYPVYGMIGDTIETESAQSEFGKIIYQTDDL